MKEECPDREKNDVAVDHFAINYASLAELFGVYKRMKDENKTELHIKR